MDMTPARSATWPGALHPGCDLSPGVDAELGHALQRLVAGLAVRAHLDRPRRGEQQLPVPWLPGRPEGTRPPGRGHLPAGALLPGHQLAMASASHVSIRGGRRHTSSAPVIICHARPGQLAVVDGDRRFTYAG